MSKRINNKTKSQIKIKKEKTITYNFPEGPINCYISEATAPYGRKKPFTIYYLESPKFSFSFSLFMLRLST